MRHYRGNEAVDPGIYFDRRELQFKSMAEEGRLPGGADTSWVRVPAVTLLVAGPLLGAIYAIFLPFIGFALLLSTAASKLWEGVGRLRAARLPRPAWAQAEKGAAPEAWAGDVEDELERRETGAPPAG